MDDVDSRAQITTEDLAAARALYKGMLADCPFCGGWSKHDPRYAPVRYDVTICLSEARDTWYVRCFSCYACTTSTESAAHAVERWNRRVAGLHAEQQLLPLVDLQSIARRAGVELTTALEVFARHVQADVLRLNRRPLQ